MEANFQGTERRPSGREHDVGKQNLGEKKQYFGGRDRVIQSSLYGLIPQYSWSDIQRLQLWPTLAQLYLWAQSIYLASPLGGHSSDSASLSTKPRSKGGSGFGGTYTNLRQTQLPVSGSRSGSNSSSNSELWLELWLEFRLELRLGPIAHIRRLLCDMSPFLWEAYTLSCLSSALAETLAVVIILAAGLYGHRATCIQHL